MLRLLLYILLIAHLLSCNIEPFKNDINYDIILVIGQSNTSNGLGLSRKIDIPDDNIFQLGRFSLYDHVIIPAEEPLHHHTIDEHKIGFALTFAKLYNKNANPNKKPIIIIPCGYGGSNLNEDWKPGSLLYNDAIERVKFIIQKYPKSQLKTILFHQGEANAGDNNYELLLDDFINKIRDDFDNSKTPFIIGGLMPSWVKKLKVEKIQSILKNTPNRVANCGYADPEIPFVIKKEIDLSDDIHYDAKGQRELGRRYFTAYQKVINP